MYEENEKRIDWKNILKRLLIFVAVLLVIFGFITLVTKCSRNNKDNDIKEPVTLVEQLNLMQEATLKYLTKDNLPTNINDSKTVKLKYLIDRKLTSNIKDSEGNVCDTNASFAEVTRLENNYALRISLTCGDNSDYRIIYIGCFDNCANGGICTGSENSTGGVCSIIEEKPSNTNTDANQTTKPSTSTNTNNKPSSNTNNKPNSGNNNNNNSNNSNSNNNSNNNNSNNTPKITYYEYQRTVTTEKCDVGTLRGGVCEVYRNKNVQGEVKPGQTIWKDKVETKYFKSTSELISQGYTYQGYVKGYGYKGTKTTKQAVSTPVSCVDPSYTYDAKTNTCSTIKSVLTYDMPRVESKTETTWSSQTSLTGWTRTGKTMTE